MTVFAPDSSGLGRKEKVNLTLNVLLILTPMLTLIPEPKSWKRLKKLKGVALAQR